MLNEQRDSYLLYMNGKPVAIGPDFETCTKLVDTVARDRPDAEFVIRVGDRLTHETSRPIFDETAPTWHYHRGSKTWKERAKQK